MLQFTTNLSAVDILNKIWTLLLLLFAHLLWDPKKTFCSIFEKLSCSVDKYEVVTALRRDQTSHNDRSKPLLGILLSNYPIILFTYIMITALKINF